VGAVSALSAGALSDRLDGRHGRVIFPSIVLLTVALCVLAFVDMANKYYVALVLLSLVSFLLIPPDSFLSGVIAMDLGGKQGS
jgi:sugar phosphate permease